MTSNLMGMDESFGPGKASNSKGIRTYQLRWLVFTPDGEGAYSAGSALGLPVIGNQHPEDPLAWCETLDVDPHEHVRDQNNNKGWVYHVTANYTSEVEITQNPLNEPAIIELNGEQYQERCWRNRDNEAIINKAGDQVETVQKDGTRLSISFTQNMASIPAWVLSALDTVNSAPITIRGLTIGTNVAKYQGPSVPNRKFRNGVTYYEVSGTLHCRSDQWKVFPLNEGMRQVYSLDTTKRIPCWQDQLVPVSSKVPLDASGFQIANPSATNLVYLEDDVYQEFDFSTIVNSLIGV